MEWRMGEGGAWYSETDRGGQVVVSHAMSGSRWRWRAEMAIGIVESQYYSNSELCKGMCKAWMSGDRVVTKIGERHYMAVDREA